MAPVMVNVHDSGKNIVGVVVGCDNHEVVALGVMASSDKILKTDRIIQANMIALRDLITSPLDEMVQGAKETVFQHETTCLPEVAWLGAAPGPLNSESPFASSR